MILHTSVLMTAVLEQIMVKPNCHYVDCTFGGGGHTEAILRRNGPRGSMLALELDPATIARGEDKLAEFKKRLTIHRGNFRDIGAIVDALAFGPVSGILYDFGLSMDLLKQSSRGFSFLVDEPLDMRFDLADPFTAADLVASWTETQIADILHFFSEEQFARRIARGIVEERKKNPITTSGHLVAVIERSVPAVYKIRKTHCATKTFQAIRMAVNDEIGAIEQSLASALQIIAPGGRIVVITFHSVEDRVVKKAFRAAADTGQFRLPIKKPIGPDEAEVKQNPASRSAKLRVIEKVSNT